MSYLFSNIDPPSNPVKGPVGVINVWGLKSLDDSLMTEGEEVSVTSLHPAIVRLEKTNTLPESLPNGIVTTKSGVGRWVWVGWIEKT